MPFIDDDAFPARDWLTKALARLQDRKIAAVGGPGLTPAESGFRERTGGAFYESFFGSGKLRARFRSIGPVRPVDDWPAFNFIVRREALAAVGGWQSTFYGGEDTKLCLALRDAGFRIVYDPDVVVYHHRRPIFGPHLRRVGNVGRHLGRGVIGMERFRREGPAPEFDWQSALRRLEKVALEVSSDWLVHVDPHERRIPPWPATTLRDALYHVDRSWFNCVDHTMLVSPPTDDEFVAGSCLGGHFRWFEFGHRRGTSSR